MATGGRGSTHPSPRRRRSSLPTVGEGDLASPSVLRQYAFIADGCRGALLGPHGEVAWLCFPSWADPALFAGVIGSGGVFRLAPEGRYVPGGFYEDDSLIWRCRFVTEDGIIESREALAYPSKPDRALLLRRIRVREGRGRLLVTLDPASDYGRRRIGPWRHEGTAALAERDRLQLRLSGSAFAVARPVGSGDGLVFRLDLEPGRDYDLVLELSDSRLTAELPQADDCWRATEESWRRSVPSCDGLPARHDVKRSVAVLRGMTDLHGGTVAAATTSLPERVERDRNYDYRFCWVRDVCFIGHAGAALEGAEALLDDATRWVAARLLADGEKTAPAYLGDGHRIFPPTRLRLPGYPGGNDVIGNAVHDQFQLDVFGEALLLFAAAMAKDRLDVDGWRAGEIALDAIAARYQEKECGVWELAPRHWSHSRLICVAGLRALASTGAPASFSARALPLADHLLDEVSASCLHASGRWQRAPDDERVDSALLLAQIRGAISPDDPRSVRTREAIASELTDEHYVYRYSTPGQVLGEDEGAFLICNFWMALAQLQAGETVDAVRYFERARAAVSTSGLFSEEFDVAEHQLRGNLPQAFVHAELIEAAAAQGAR